MRRRRKEAAQLRRPLLRLFLINNRDTAYRRHPVLSSPMDILSLDSAEQGRMHKGHRSRGNSHDDDGNATLDRRLAPLRLDQRNKLLEPGPVQKH